jgi:imidazolonepropionase
MTATLLDGLGVLVTNDPTHPHGDGTPLGRLVDGAVVLADGAIAWVGPRRMAPAVDVRLDLGGRALLPGFVDSHTHLVFARDRVGDFTAVTGGRPEAAGGIASTVAATRAADDAALRTTATRLRGELTRAGVTTVEVKSGYGLTIADEARCLALAGELTDEVTFLGAHVVPPEYAQDRAGYVALVCGAMLDACAPAAHWVDVFCDVGAFDVDEARAVLLAGQERGLGLRVHANQHAPGPGVQLAVELGAASADHCTHLTDRDIEALAAGSTVATLLPTADLGVRGPFPDARRLLDAGAVVALATDCNPGTSFTTAMPLVVALGVLALGMTPDEAVWAATAGGARALRRGDVGQVRVGARADLLCLDAPIPEYLAYRPGVDLVHAVWRAGTVVHRGR